MGATLRLACNLRAPIGMLWRLKCIDASRSKSGIALQLRIDRPRPRMKNLAA